VHHNPDDAAIRHHNEPLSQDKAHCISRSPNAAQKTRSPPPEQGQEDAHIFAHGPSPLLRIQRLQTSDVPFASLLLVAVEERAHGPAAQGAAAPAMVAAIVTVVLLLLVVLRLVLVFRSLLFGKVFGQVAGDRTADGAQKAMIGLMTGETAGRGATDGA
jgi:hypothetical protein